MTGRRAETVLAFDFGVRRIGVAVGNSLTGGAEPVATIVATNDPQRFKDLALVIREWKPQRLVVGRPFHPDGRSLPITARCERFARQLGGRFGLPVAIVDESYSSVEADRDQALEGWSPSDGGRRGVLPARSRRRAPGASHDDAMAAAIILRQYWNERPST